MRITNIIGSWLIHTVILGKIHLLQPEKDQTDIEDIKESIRIMDEKMKEES